MKQKTILSWFFILQVLLTGMLPLVGYYSSLMGQEGSPKPITMTYGSFAVVDNAFNQTKTPERKNRDFPIWRVEGGGKFCTVFPYFHVGILPKRIVRAGKGTVVRAVTENHLRSAIDRLYFEAVGV